VRADSRLGAQADGRSIYVGQVDYSATPEELQEHFASCGTVNRVTILCDQYRNPKGYAYIEFDSAEAVEAAVLLNDSEFKSRQLKARRSLRRRACTPRGDQPTPLGPSSPSAQLSVPSAERGRGPLRVVRR
jgi:polyadenylate-binding protein 2